MKLYYSSLGNFGDDLNPWLWPKIFENIFTRDDQELFVGIGTLLNDKLPSENVKHILGSGFGYGGRPKIDKNCRIHAVRGPITARELGIDKKKAITDPAILVRLIRCFKKADTIEYEYGFIPHHVSCANFDWESICVQLGFRYIDVKWNVEKVLFEMSKCNFLICEAMHGAIVADTLRIPWIPVKLYDHINELKWKDWLLTVGLPYKPVEIESIYDIERKFSFYKKSKNNLKHLLKTIDIYSHLWDLPLPKSSTEKNIENVKLTLEKLKDEEKYLSSSDMLAINTERYLKVLDNFKNENDLLYCKEFMDRPNYE